MLQLQDRLNHQIDSGWLDSGHEWYRAIWLEAAELMEHYGWVGDHLALEDDTLYKELLVHPDPELQRTARNFLSGSHELWHLFTDYMQHACKPDSKSKECEAFVKESQDIFEMLEKRIEFEESKFYPLAEKA